MLSSSKQNFNEEIKMEEENKLLTTAEQREIIQQQLVEMFHNKKSEIGIKLRQEIEPNDRLTAILETIEIALSAVFSEKNNKMRRKVLTSCIDAHLRIEEVDGDTGTLHPSKAARLGWWSEIVS